VAVRAPASPPDRQDSITLPPQLAPAVARPKGDEGTESGPQEMERPAPVPASLPRSLVHEIPAWLRHAHWLMVLALVPLALSLLGSDAAEEDRVTRMKETLDRLTPEEQARVLDTIKEVRDGELALDLVFEAIPEHKLAGAFLPRDTWIHWTFGAGAAALFLGFFLLLAAHGTAERRHLLGLGLFTATVGIGLLLLFQRLADWSQGVWFTGRGVLVIFFYVVKFIGFSYRAALDPENGLILSFVGFTCGVGLCEEVVKALPLFWHYRRPNRQSWRGAFLWGLASGAGFGIAEGIMYAGSDYNGFAGPGIYFVRFVSCVALHAIWTGSVGITLHRQQDLMQGVTAWYEFLLPVLRIVVVPVVLHGLYDTLLKKEMNVGALAIAAFSFLFLAYQISRMHGEDERALVGTAPVRQ